MDDVPGCQEQHGHHRRGGEQYRPHQESRCRPIRRRRRDAVPTGKGTDALLQHPGVVARGDEAVGHTRGRPDRELDSPPAVGERGVAGRRKLEDLAPRRAPDPGAVGPGDPHAVLVEREVEVGDGCGFVAVPTQQVDPAEVEPVHLTGGVLWSGRSHPAAVLGHPRRNDARTIGI